MPTYKITGPDGRKFKISGPNKEGALVALQAQLAGAATQPAPDTSLSGALVQGYDQAGAMVGKGIQSLGEYASIPSVENYGREMADRNEAEIAASGYQRPEGADGIIKNLREGEFANAGNSLLYGATEALPQVGGGVVASVGAGLAATTAPILGTAAAVGGTLYGAVNALGQVRDEKETKGLDPTANAADLATAAASGLVELLPIKGGGATLRVMREAGQEAVQEGLIIGDTMVQGGEYVPQEVVDRLGDAAVIGGTIAKGANMATSAASKVADVVTPAPREDTPENRANASFAQRIQRISTTGDLNGVPFNLKDVNSGSAHGVRAAMDASHTDLVGQIADDAKVLRASLASKDTDPFDLALEKVQAQVGIKMAKNKTKSVVTKDNFDALEKLVGRTEEGQNLLNLVRESQVLTELHNNEYKGGVSRFTDLALPFDNAQNGYNVGAQVARNITTPTGSLGLALYTGGGSIPYQAGVVAAGRGIDAVTGRRSRVDRFVNKNKDAAGLEIPAGLPSVRKGRIDDARLAEDQKAASEAASAASLAQRTERLKQTNLGLAKKNAPPVPTSPQGTVEAATGLNRSGVARILRVVEATNQDPLIGEAIQAYRGTVAVGGRVPDISPLIRTINQMVESQPAFKQMRVREPDTGVAQAASTGSPIQTSPENYQRGIDDNKAMLQDLKDGAKTDPTMSPADKSKVLGALDEMGMNLGTDPAGKVNEILSGLDGVDPDAVAAYVEPYAARVIGQQDGPVRGQVTPPEATPPQVTPPKFGGKTDVGLDTSLANAFTLAKDEVFAKGRDLKMQLQEMSLKAQEREGIDLTTLDDANIDRLADFVVADALEAIKDNANAIGWYDRTITKALETVGELYPEVLTDPAAKLQLIWAVAVTSNGLKVDKNFEIALAAYQGIRDTGRFPTKSGIGQAASAINSGLAQYHTMLDKFNGDPVALAQFMNSQIPVKQLEKEYGVKISGEGKNTLVRGASILGPKIGNGFFSNLYGNFDELTMDRWLMRTVGRWRGSLVKINKPMISKKTSEIQGILAGLKIKDFKPLFANSDISPKGKMSKANVELLSAEIAKLSMDPKWREDINAIEGGEDLRKAGNGLAKYLDGQVEAPAGAKERDFIREVFKRGLKQLQDLPEIKNGSNTELTMSDLQALLWYPEKRLYDTAKQKDGGESRGYEDDEAPDYANAARKAVGDRLGSTGGTGPAGGGPIGPNAGQPRQSIQGGGILSGTSPTPNNPTASSPPKVAEVKQQAPLANASIEIGKAGSEFENGIKDLEGVQRLADAYNVVIKFYNSNEDMRTAVPTASTSAMGVYQQRERVVSVVRTGDLNELTTALHETLHGVGVSSMGTGNYLGELPTQNGLTGRPDVYGSNSIEGIMDFVLGKAKNDPVRREVLSELKHIQERAEFSSGGASVPIRGAKSMAMMLKDLKKQYAGLGVDFAPNRVREQKRLKDFQNYQRSIGELTVDALILYAHDPKTMKRVAPATAQLIRDMFKKAGNKKIQFYNHPLAMVVAVVMAILAKSQAPEEEEQQQMPAGALSPQLGMLSA